MQKTVQSAIERRVPATILAIAQRLGEPMLANRVWGISVSTHRRFQVWEFQPLNSGCGSKVVAVDIRGSNIADWKLLEREFDDAVHYYQAVVDSHRA